MIVFTSCVALESEIAHCRNADKLLAAIWTVFACIFRSVLVQIQVALESQFVKCIQSAVRIREKWGLDSLEGFRERKL